MVMFGTIGLVMVFINYYDKIQLMGRVINRIKYDTLSSKVYKKNKTRIGSLKQILHYYYTYPQEGKFFRDSLWGGGGIFRIFLWDNLLKDANYFLK